MPVLTGNVLHILQTVQLHVQKISSLTHLLSLAQQTLSIHALHVPQTHTKMLIKQGVLLVVVECFTI